MNAHLTVTEKEWDLPAQFQTTAQIKHSHLLSHMGKSEHLNSLLWRMVRSSVFAIQALSLLQINMAILFPALTVRKLTVTVQPALLRLSAQAVVIPTRCLLLMDRNALIN